MTKYAQAIQQIVESSGCHMTADQIFIQLRQIYPTVALATVYNNLGKLCQSGLLRKISAEGMPDRYDRPQRHDHLDLPGLRQAGRSAPERSHRSTAAAAGHPLFVL